MIKFSKDFHKMNEYFINDDELFDMIRDNNIISYGNNEEKLIEFKGKKAILKTDRSCSPTKNSKIF
jgi:hypothetical protein